MAGQTQLGTGTVVFGDGTTQSSAGVISVANGTILELNSTITSSYTITSGKNGFSVGPLTLNNGVTVTVPSGSRWVIL